MIKLSHKVIHKGCDFSDDLKNTVSCPLQSTEFVRTRLDKLSTVVVEVASFVGNPVLFQNVNVIGKKNFKGLELVFICFSNLSKFTVVIFLLNSFKLSSLK